MTWNGFTWIYIKLPALKNGVISNNLDLQLSLKTGEFGNTGLIIPQAEIRWNWAKVLYTGLSSWPQYNSPQLPPGFLVHYYHVVLAVIYKVLSAKLSTVSPSFVINSYHCPILGYYLFGNWKKSSSSVRSWVHTIWGLLAELCLHLLGC